MYLLKYLYRLHCEAPAASHTFKTKEKNSCHLLNSAYDITLPLLIDVLPLHEAIYWKNQEDAVDVDRAYAGWVFVFVRCQIYCTGKRFNLSKLVLAATHN